MNWFVWALLSAVFAAMTAILAKLGVAGVNSDVATAIRTTVVLGLAWIVAVPGLRESPIDGIGRTPWVICHRRCADFDRIDRIYGIYCQKAEAIRVP